MIKIQYKKIEVEYVSEKDLFLTTKVDELPTHVIISDEIFSLTPSKKGDNLLYSKNLIQPIDALRLLSKLEKDHLIYFI